MSSARDFEASVRRVLLFSAMPPRVALTTLGVMCIAGVEATTCESLEDRTGRGDHACPPRRLDTTLGVSGRRRLVERDERESGELAGIIKTP